MLLRRSTKYPEHAHNFTKTAVTVMMCGSTTGVLLPPNIVLQSREDVAAMGRNGTKRRTILQGEIACRNVFTNWKATYKQQSSVSKIDFSQMFATTLIEMIKKSNNAIENDLISSFQATGIISIDPERILREISVNDGGTGADINDALLNYLQQQRF
ncbi:hypothetical protein GWI33_015615 [Rhynchophorus ferrugineus]|uniref:Uncharacterized protein n=1 Tax=Rhynchophorus ferrugineus TaxID=354439 RepID=A0A834MB92_RHYFE|nr:hypothetical protein GWI33_015615 [Rhynchophorus ferrugineus]